MILIGLVFYLDNPPAHCLQVAIPVPPGILTALPTVSTKKVRQMLLNELLSMKQITAKHNFFL